MVVHSQESLTFATETLRYLLVRSKKRKRSLSLKITVEGSIQLNVPYHTAMKEIEAFISSRYYWIKSKRVTSDDVPVPLRYENNEPHLFKGTNYYLSVFFGQKARIIIDNERLLVYCRGFSSVINVLNNWYKQQARAYLTERTHYFMNLFNFPDVQEIRIRNMKARWGSCSSGAVITYNTHLIKAELTLIDYVVLHELCHLIQPNHGPLFYRLQSQVNPNWQAQKKLLNQHGLKIMHQ